MMEMSEQVRPRGRDEVVAALIATATRLFSERGPRAVSLRDVAAEADVNLGLIHRYVGSKDDLLAAVLGSRASWPLDLGLPAESPEEIVDTFLQMGFVDVPYLQVMLRAALDGYDIRRLRHTMPLLERAARGAQANLPRRDADVRTAMLTAALFGWQAIGPLLLEILKQRDIGPEELSDILRPALLGFLRADP